MDKPLKSFFKKFLERETIFVNKEVLEISFTPKNILHRNKQIEEIAEILAPALKFSKPSNVFIYGKTGTGKTVTVNRVVYDLVEVAREENVVPLNYVYVNCKLGRADTEYRLIAYLCRELGINLPSTGLPTDEVYNIFYKIVDEKKQLLIIILDEIDQLIFKMGDDVLYTLTRINSYLSQSKISLIGISNYVKLLEQVDPRVKSSLGEESVVFPPYDANQIKDILEDRAKRAFRIDALEQGVLEKCAAIAAREHGDARRAIDLLRVAGELADRESAQKITLKHLDAAQDKLEKDRVLDLVASQPKQHQSVLLSLILLDNTKKSDDTITTGLLYEKYVRVCKSLDLRPLTQRRISDILSEFDSLGLIQSIIKSRGRLGRTRDINIAFDLSLRPRVVTLLKESLGY